MHWWIVENQVRYKECYTDIPKQPILILTQLLLFNVIDFELLKDEY